MDAPDTNTTAERPDDRTSALLLKHERVCIKQLRPLLVAFLILLGYSCSFVARGNVKTTATTMKFGASRSTPDPLGDIDDTARIYGYVARDVVYGHVHVAKTAGTSINGMLATRYERVCGNKGYSFNFIQANAWNNNTVPWTERRNKPGSGKGWPDFMRTVGFEDCDYISMEASWEFWKEFNHWPQPLELHVPCRDPIDHLLSMFNHKRKVFRCDIDSVLQLKAHMFHMKRFSKQLASIKNIHLKCFNSNVTFTKYMKYAERILQKRRIQAPYIFRETNKPRVKEEECLWNNTQAQAEVKAYLIENYDYYSYCDQCLGSKDDLFV